jgi:hypothetical protein
VAPRLGSLTPTNAKQCEFLVCTRNAFNREPPSEGNEPHASAFRIGRISGVIPAPEDPTSGRFMVQFEAYAELAIPNAWQAWRNPVRYSTLEEIGVDLDKLIWKRRSAEMRAASATVPRAPEPTMRLTITEAKKGLAATYGVAPEAIEITIRG